MKNRKAIKKILFFSFCVSVTLLLFQFFAGRVKAYEDPSLIKCENNEGICYDNASGGCPNGVTKLIDKNNNCGTAYSCCAASANQSCASGDGVCVDNTVLCISESKTDTSCGTKKCCLNNIPSFGSTQEVKEYEDPSLITCSNKQGLCYDKKAGGCPSNAQQLNDINSECGTAYVCCGVSFDQSCSSGDGVCVDSTVICISEDKSDTTCGSKKCCLRNIPTVTVDPVVEKTDPTIYASQCDSSNNNCTNANDQAILNNQCKNLFDSMNCSSMSVYLNYLAHKCIQMQPIGIDCALITSAGYYGNEASKFATYFIQNANVKSNPTGDTGDNSGILDTGDVDFSGLENSGLPDSVGGIKPILVNIAKWLLEIIGIIALISFIISGGQYLISAGDEKMIDTAKRNMTYSIIGVIVALSGFIIIRAVDTALRASSTMF